MRLLLAALACLFSVAAWAQSPTLSSFPAVSSLQSSTDWFPMLRSGAATATGYSNNRVALPTFSAWLQSQGFPAGSVNFAPPWTGGASSSLQARGQNVVFASDFGASGSKSSTTGTITGGLTALSLGSALDFANGEGILVAGAGITFSAAQPSATASVVGTTGSTTYTYYVASVDANGGVGIPVTTHVTTGDATLSAANYVSLAITPGSGAAAYLIWKQVGAGTIYYLGSGQASTYVDTGLQSHDQNSSGTGPYRPWWAPSAPPSQAQNDWLVTSVSSGGGTTSLTLAAAAVNGVSGATVYHDDTVALSDCVNSALSTGNGSGADCRLPCGYYRTSGTLSIAHDNSGFTGAREVCATVAPSGAADDIATNGTNRDFLRDIYVLDTGNKAAGWCVNASGGGALDVEYLNCDHPYSGVLVYNWNNWTFSHIVIERFFSQQGSLVAMETSQSGTTCCGDMTDIYGHSSGGPQGDLSTGQIAYLMDGAVNTVICRNCDVSDIAGDELRTSNSVSAPGTEPQFIQFSDFGGEYATGWSVNLLSGLNIEFVNGYAHAGHYDNYTTCQASGDFHVGTGVAGQWQWIGGGIANGSGDNAYLEGNQGQFLGAHVIWGSGNQGGTPGQCPAVELAGTANRIALSGNTIGDQTHPTWQKYPVQLDSGASLNGIVGNTWAGNVNSFVNDQSGQATNVVGPNGGDTQPVLTVDNADGAVGVNTASPFTDTGSAPGLSVAGSNSGGDVRSVVVNKAANASGNTSTLEAALTGAANAYGLMQAQYNGGTPRLQISAGAGMTGGLVLNSSAGVQVSGGALGIPASTWADNQTCTTGQISVDASFVYVCTATNTVKRVALSAF